MSVLYVLSASNHAAHLIALVGLQYKYLYDSLPYVSRKDRNVLFNDSLNTFYLWL